MSQDAAVAEQNPEEHLSPVDSASNSVLSTPTNKAENDELKAYGEGEEHEPC